MSRAENDHCRQVADYDDMERFTLIAQDSTAPRTICWWILENIDTAPSDKLKEAFKCALEMRDYPHRKKPD